MKFHFKNLNFLIITVICFELSGCGVALATTAGLTAYNASQAGKEGSEIAIELTKKIPNSYFVATSQNKAIVLAGQTINSADIYKAKEIIAAKYDDYTVYSYVTIEQAESTKQQQIDHIIDKEVKDIIKINAIKNLSFVTANNIVYLLSANKNTPANLDRVSDAVIKVTNVKNVVTIREYSPS